MIKINLLDILKEILKTDELKKPLLRIGETLDNVIYVVFNPINFNVEKLKIRQSADLDAYKRDIVREISLIPKQNLKEPDMSILGPALEASKYYIGDYEMRKLFAKLISASMNTKDESKVHHSFVEIIKQMSPLDAIMLRNLYEAGGKENSYVLVMTPIYDNGNNYEKEVVLDNLKRLGLIMEISKDIEVIYSPPERDGYFESPGEVYVENHGTDRYDTVITAFGKNFCEVCI